MFFLGLHIFTYSDTFQVHKSGPPCFRLSWQSLNLTGQNRSRKTIRSSKHLTVCLSDHPFIHVSIFLSVSLSLSPLSIRPSIHPFMHPSIHPWHSLSECPTGWLGQLLLVRSNLGARSDNGIVQSYIYIYI